MENNSLALRPSPILPRTIEDVERIARKVAMSPGFVPKSYLVDPYKPEKGADEHKIFVAIMHGMEVGFPPMMALQSIAVINGYPAIWGDGMLGLVRQSGMLIGFEEFLEGEPGSPDRAGVCRVKRRDARTGVEESVERRFSMADAKRAGLLEKKGPWQTYPQRMIAMRARSWALRDTFADVLRGLRSAEELLYMGDLVDQGDGVYTPAGDPPPRPTAQDFRPAEDESGAIRMVDADGSHRWVYDTPEAFVEDLAKFVRGKPDDEKGRILAANADAIAAVLAGNPDLEAAVNAMRGGQVEAGQEPEDHIPDEDDGDRAAWELYADNLIGEIKSSDPDAVDDVIASNSDEIETLRGEYPDLADRIADAVEARRPKPAPKPGNGIRRPPKKGGGNVDPASRALFP